MKKNLLFFLFAVLMGVVSAQAQTTVTIEVDNAANVIAHDGGPYGTGIILHNGPNTVALQANPLSIEAAEGAKIESVTANGSPVTPNYQGFYNIGVSEGMKVKIVTSGAASTVAGVMFGINIDNSATVTSGGVTTSITNYATIDLKRGEYAVIAPADGYNIVELSPVGINNITENSDGTVSFLPEANGFIQLTTKMNGINFNVDINVPSNVHIEAFGPANEELGTVELEGYKTPYSATAPLDAASITFTAPTGGEIMSIKLITASGTESNISFSSYAGWRSALAEGDTFVIDALGPQANIKFSGYDNRRNELDLSNFVIKAGEQTLALTGVTAQAGVRIGETLSVTAAAGFTLTEYGLSGGAIRTLVTQGSEQTALVINSGEVYLTASSMSGYIINVDNAKAVTVTGANGNGAVLNLGNGENMLQSVANPLKIVANEKYTITSVTLDGVAVNETNGYYLAELMAGSTLTIRTAEIVTDFPITVTTTNGDIDELIITKDGEVVKYGPDFTGNIGTVLTFKANLGSIIESVDDFNGNSVEYDETTEVYTVNITKSSCMLSINFKVPGQGKAFVGFSRDNPDVFAYLYDKDGNRKDNPASLKAGSTVEVEIGDLVEIYLWSDKYNLNEILVNDNEVEIAEGVKSVRVAIEGKTVIKVTTTEREQLVDIWGDTTIETETSSGVLIGSIYINEIGQNNVFLRPGEKFYVIPVPEKGYRFAGFKHISWNLPVPEPVDGKYEFTVPEGVEYVQFKGDFVPDEENPAYIIEGNSIYVGEGMDTKLVGLTRIDNGTATGALIVTALAGDVMKLLFFLNIDEFPADEYYCESFCLFNDPEVLISQEYVVNPDDVYFGNVISIGAIVKKIPGGFADINADSALRYDAATATVHSAEVVKVFAATGALVMELPEGQSSIAALPSGLYILNNGLKTIKIVK